MTAPADPGPALDSAPLPPDVHAVVTRDEDPEHGRLGVALRRLGVPVLHWRTTAVLPPADPSALRALADGAGTYDWVVFTSRRAVAAVAEVVGAAPDGVRVAALGAKTAEAAREAGWPPDLSGGETGIELAESLRARLGGGTARILYPTTPLAADTLPDLLARGGHTVDRIEAYRTGYADLDLATCAPAIDTGAVGVVTFTSPSAVEGLRRALPADLLDRLVAGSRAVSIGPTTGEAVAAAGWDPRESRETSLEGVARRAAELLRSHATGQDG